jgi:organizing structure protein 2
MVTLVETPHPISPYIAQAREATTDVLGGAKGYVEEGVSKWIGFEKRVERESPPLHHNSGLEAD